MGSKQIKRLLSTILAMAMIITSSPVTSLAEGLSAGSLGEETAIMEEADVSAGEADISAAEIEEEEVEEAEPVLAEESFDENIFTSDGKTTISLGTSLTISEGFAVTSGVSETYQWYSCSDNSKSNPVAIDGATSYSYTFTAGTDLKDCGYYYFYCVVNAGGEIKETDAVKITVTVTGKEPSTSQFGEYIGDTYWDSKGIKYDSDTSTLTLKGYTALDAGGFKMEKDTLNIELLGDAVMKVNGEDGAFKLCPSSHANVTISGQGTLYIEVDSPEGKAVGAFWDEVIDDSDKSSDLTIGENVDLIIICNTSNSKAVYIGGNLIVNGSIYASTTRDGDYVPLYIKGELDIIDGNYIIVPHNGIIMNSDENIMYIYERFGCEQDDIILARTVCIDSLSKPCVYFLEVEKEELTKYYALNSTVSFIPQAAVQPEYEELLTYQWYMCDENRQNPMPLEGTEEDAGAISTSSIGTQYMYCVASVEYEGKKYFAESPLYTVVTNHTGKKPADRNLSFGSKASETNEEEGWSWDHDNKVLTLSGLELDKVNGDVALLGLPADSKVVLSEGSVSYIDGLLSCSGDLTIEGPGTLWVDGRQSKIIEIKNEGDLTITNGAKIYIDRLSGFSSTGLYAPGKVEISGESEVISTVPTYTDCFIYGGQGIAIENSTVESTTTTCTNGLLKAGSGSYIDLIDVELWSEDCETSLYYEVVEEESGIRVYFNDTWAEYQKDKYLLWTGHVWFKPAKNCLQSYAFMISRCSVNDQENAKRLKATWIDDNGIEHSMEIGSDSMGVIAGEGNIPAIPEGTEITIEVIDGKVEDTGNLLYRMHEIRGITSSGGNFGYYYPVETGVETFKVTMKSYPWSLVFSPDDITLVEPEVKFRWGRGGESLILDISDSVPGYDSTSETWKLADRYNTDNCSDNLEIKIIDEDGTEIPDSPLKMPTGEGIWTNIFGIRMNAPGYYLFDAESLGMDKDKRYFINLDMLYARYGDEDEKAIIDKLHRVYTLEPYNSDSEKFALAEPEVFKGYDEVRITIDNSTDEERNAYFTAPIKVDIPFGLENGDMEELFGVTDPDGILAADGVEYLIESDGKAALKIKAQAPEEGNNHTGTSYINLFNFLGEPVVTVRVDVVNGYGDFSEARLVTTKATVNLYSEAWTTFSMDMLNPVGADIIEVALADEAAGKVFDIEGTGYKSFRLRAKESVATEPGLADSVKSKYTSKVVWKVKNGNTVKTVTSTNALTITVKKTKPTVTAGKISINTFYEDASAPIILTSKQGQVKNVDITNLSMTDIKVDIDKMLVSVPGTGVKVSGTITLSAMVEGYFVPVQVKLSISAKSTAPKVKLGASTITVPARADLWGDVTVSLASGDKKIKYEDLNITDLRVADHGEYVSLSAKDKKTYGATEAYKLENFDPATGMAKLKYTDDSQVVSGGVLLIATIGNNAHQTVKLKLTVKTTGTYSWKLSTTKVTLTRATGCGGIDIKITTNPLNLRINPEVNVYDDKGNLIYDYEGGLTAVYIEDGSYITVNAYVNCRTNAGIYKVVVTDPSGIFKKQTITVTVKDSVPKLKVNKASQSANMLSRESYNGYTPYEYVITADAKTAVMYPDNLIIEPASDKYEIVRDDIALNEWFMREKTAEGEDPKEPLFDIAVTKDSSKLNQLIVEVYPQYGVPFDNASYKFNCSYGWEWKDDAEGNSVPRTTSSTAFTFKTTAPSVKLKADKTSVTLGKMDSDKVKVNVTAPYNLVPGALKYGVYSSDGKKAFAKDNEPLDVEISRMNAYVKQNEQAEPGKTYVVKLWYKYSLGKGTVDKSQAVSVKVKCVGNEATPVLTTKLKGNLDISKPGQTVKATTTFKNISGENGTLSYKITDSTGESVGYLAYDSVTGTIGINTEAASYKNHELPSTGKFKVAAVFTSANGEVYEESKPVTLTLKCTKLKAQASTTKVTLNSYDPYDIQYVAFNVPGFDASQVYEVKLSGSSKNYEFIHVRGNIYALVFNGRTVKGKPKKETLTFNVYASGNSSAGTPNGTVKVTVGVR